jgi:large repetitive protein
VSTQFGCLDSITKQLYVNFAYHLYVPNAYTPNADALNDGFKPVALGLKSYELEIYNRWGEKIFVSSDAEPAWLGTDAETGYYFYQIRAFDFTGLVHYYNGVVHLLR